MRIWTNARILLGLFLAGLAGYVFGIADPDMLVSDPAPQAVPTVPQHVNTIFVPLDLETHVMQVSRRGTGGGVGEYRGAPVVIAHTGQIATLVNGVLQETPILAPVSGYQDLAARLSTDMAKAAGQTMNHDWFRFSDVLVVSDPLGGSGHHVLLVAYTEWQPERVCYGTVLAGLPIDADVDTLLQMKAGPADWRVLFRTEPCLGLLDRGDVISPQMAGGRLVDLGDGTVGLTSGDHNFDGVTAPGAPLAQADWGHYGRLLEIDLLTGQATELARGLRNPQGLVADGQGRFWAIDHGPRGGDELNLVRRGANFGWPDVTLGTRYDGQPWPSTGAYGRHDAHEPPAFAWLPSVGLSALERIDGVHPAWDGDLIAGSLKGQSLHRIRVRDGRVLFSEQIRIGQRIRGIRQLSGGRLALWTDHQRLILVRAGAGGHVQQAITAFIEDLEAAESLKHGLGEAIAGCQQCHGFEPGEHAGAPNLGRIAGAPIAAEPGFAYSAALAEREERWSSAALSAFIDDPSTFAPGTTMPDPGVDDPALLKALVALLHHTAGAQQP